MIPMKKILRRVIVLCLLMQLLITFPVKAFAESEEAIFAGGCFWCLEHDLEKLDGVVLAESGYSGGDLTNPTYENHSGHQEVVKVSFDPNIIRIKTNFHNLLMPTMIFICRINKISSRVSTFRRNNSIKLL